MIVKSAEEFKCYKCIPKDSWCDTQENIEDLPQTVCPSRKCLISEYQCGDTISDDCRSEYNNAINNGNLDYFYERCATEGGSQPLRTRCSLCCDENDNTAVLRKCAKINDGIIPCDEEPNGGNVQECICDTNLCNDFCTDCNSSSKQSSVCLLFELTLVLLLIKLF